MDLLSLAQARAAARAPGIPCRTCSGPYRAEIEAMVDAGLSLRVIAETLSVDANWEIGPGAIRNHLGHRHRRGEG